MSWVCLTPSSLPKLVWSCCAFPSFLLSLTATAAPSARELSLTSQLKKLQETIAQRAKLEIGDIIRARGHIRIFRGEREIHATTYCKHTVSLPGCLLLCVCPVSSFSKKSNFWRVQIQSFNEKSCICNVISLEKQCLFILKRSNFK